MPVGQKRILVPAHLARGDGLGAAGRGGSGLVSAGHERAGEEHEEPDGRGRGLETTGKLSHSDSP